MLIHPSYVLAIMICGCDVTFDFNHALELSWGVVIYYYLPFRDVLRGGLFLNCINRLTLFRVKSAREICAWNIFDTTEYFHVR